MSETKKQTEFLKKAKDYLGIKGRRRNNYESIAKFINFIPTQKDTPIKDTKSEDFINSVKREISKRYSNSLPKKVLPKKIIYSQTFSIQYFYKFKNAKEWDTAVETNTSTGTLEEIKYMNDFKEDELRKKLDSESAIIGMKNEFDAYVFIKNYGKIIKQTNSDGKIFKPINIRKLFMKDRGALKLDSCFVEDDSWDLKKGTCVFDWIFKTYADKKGIKKLIPLNNREKAYQNLNEVFLKDKRSHHENNNPLKDGVSIEMIDYFCNEFNIAYYAFDRNHNSISKFSPDVNKKLKVPMMIFVIANSHFYPIEDKKYQQSLVAKSRDNNDENNCRIFWKCDDTMVKKKKEEEEEDARQTLKPIFADDFNYTNEIIEDDEYYNKIYDEECSKIKKELIVKKQKKKQPVENKEDVNKTKNMTEYFNYINIKTEKVDDDEEYNKIYDEECSKIKKEIMRNRMKKQEEKPTTPLIGNDFLKRFIKETGIIPSDIFTNNSCVKSFMIRDQKYITNKKTELDYKIEEYCNKHSISYVGQSANNLLTSLLMEYDNTKKFITDLHSNLNPHTYKSLMVDGLKNRVHIGTTSDLQLLREQNFDCDLEVRKGNIQAYDITKCYTSCLYEPLDVFCIYDNNCNVELYCGNTDKNGLYFLETDDMTILHQSNWYSKRMVQYADDNGIKFNITHQIIASSTLPKNYFKEFMDLVIEKGKGIEKYDKIYKKLFNYLVGIIGKTQEKQSVCEIDNNIEEVWRCFLNCEEPDENVDKYFYNEKFKENKHSRFGNDNIICDDIGDIDSPLYLYGFNKKTSLNDIALPIWLQILDWSNIKLHQLQVKVGGQLLFRKTDAVLMKGCKIGLQEDGWGGFCKDNYKNYNLSYKMKTERHINKPTIDEVWIDCYDYTSSKDAVEIIKYATEKGGLLLKGCPGTGKTFVIKQNNEMTDDNTCKMAFTNRASRNCGGSTIHKTLRITKDFKIDKKTLNKFKFLNYVVIDEIGMVNTKLLNMLKIVKKFNPKLVFILCGDGGQLPPIEDNGIEVDILNHSIVKYLAHHNSIELTERQRYDLPLWEYLKEGFTNGNWGELPKVRVSPEDILNNKAICYYNKTRKTINKYCNDYFRKKNECLFIEDVTEYDKNGLEIVKQTQDTYLYKGLPIMATKNNSKIGLINSDEYIVIDYDDEKFMVQLDITGEENIIILPIEYFHNLFVMNYVATTHKSQGATYTNNIYLFDWCKLIEDRRIIYTAVSRGTALSKIFYGTI